MAKVYITQKQFDENKQRFAGFEVVITDTKKVVEMQKKQTK